jgi:succinyldiaminopimelate transaminase
MTAAPPTGFVPPPYPQDRLAALNATAAALPGGVVDASVGTPVDPMPEIAVEALFAATRAATGYPPSIGSSGYRDAAAAWIGRRFGVDVAPSAITACIGTKELVASLPLHLALGDPSRDTVLHPAVAYPTYAMGATLAGLRAVAVPVRDDWHLDLGAVDPDDAARALVLWLNDPANPTGACASRDEMVANVEWGRARGITVASDECYAEFTYDDAGAAAPPVTALLAGDAGVLAVHSLSKRSNLAGLRAGFIAGDPELVQYLGEVRKHAGFMVPAPVQAAATAALGDDEHVVAQRARYAARRARLTPALAKIGLHSVGGPSTFYVWLASERGENGWGIAARLAETAGLLVAPGDLYGSAGAAHARVALSLRDDDIDLVLQRLAEPSSASGTPGGAAR